MEERLTDQTPATTLPSPEVPASPAALFEPMAPAVLEPAMTASSVPPSTPAAPPLPKARRWPMFVAIGLVAVLVGALVGYFAGGPARDDLQRQRDDARAQVADLTGQLDANKADLASTTDMLNTAKAGLATAQADLTKSEAALTAMTDARDTSSAKAKACKTAATTANDLVVQWKNVFSDFLSWMDAPYGSAAEAQIQSHVDEQFAKMDEQQLSLNRAMETCLA